MDDSPMATERRLSFAAQQLREPYHSTRDRVLTGQLPARMIRGRWYVLQADLDRLLVARAAERDGSPTAA
jgi:hypothetical protein